MTTGTFDSRRDPDGRDQIAHRGSERRLPVPAEDGQKICGDSHANEYGRGGGKNHKSDRAVAEERKCFDDQSADQEDADNP
jgi:hypothetical protein